MEKAEYSVLLEYLQQKYPKTFGAEIKPLSFGIHKEIMDSERPYLSESQVYEFLYIYTRSDEYIKLAESNTKRINLKGHEVS